MALLFHRAFAIPLCVVAFCVLALAAPPSLIPSTAMLIGIAVVAATVVAMVRCRAARASHPLVEVRTARSCDTAHAGIIMTARRREPDDARERMVRR